jgi:hypothetical protein
MAGIAAMVARCREPVLLNAKSTLSNLVETVEFYFKTPAQITCQAQALRSWALGLLAAQARPEQWPELALACCALRCGLRTD